MFEDFSPFFWFTVKMLNCLILIFHIPVNIFLRHFIRNVWHPFRSGEQSIVLFSPFHNEKEYLSFGKRRRFMCINVDTIFQFSKISQVTQSHVVLSSHKIHVRVGFFFQKNAMWNLSILIIHHFYIVAIIYIFQQKVNPILSRESKIGIRNDIKAKKIVESNIV